jgi:hypothetical protein
VRREVNCPATSAQQLVHPDQTIRQRSGAGCGQPHLQRPAPRTTLLGRMRPRATDRPVARTPPHHHQRKIGTIGVTSSNGSSQPCRTLRFTATHVPMVTPKEGLAHLDRSSLMDASRPRVSEGRLDCRKARHPAPRAVGVEHVERGTSRRGVDVPWHS